MLGMLNFFLFFLAHGMVVLHHSINNKLATLVAHVSQRKQLLQVSLEVYDSC